MSIISCRECCFGILIGSSRKASFRYTFGPTMKYSTVFSLLLALRSSRYTSCAAIEPSLSVEAALPQVSQLPNDGQAYCSDEYQAYGKMDWPKGCSFAIGGIRHYDSAIPANPMLPITFYSSQAIGLEGGMQTPRRYNSSKSMVDRDLMMINIKCFDPG